MIWQRVRTALLASMVAMAAALPVAPGKALAGECKTADGKPCEHISSAPATTVAAPAYRTIRVTEMVPEHYTTTRTVYKTEKVEEKYTAYKIEKIPVTKSRTVTVYEKVPVEETRTRTICVNVPCVEERTCMEKHWVCKQVTTYSKKCVDQGHWECKTVECKPLFERKSKCCDPCDPCCKPKCVKTKQVKVWVPCKVWIETPCTKTIKVCEHRAVKKQVHTCKKETRCETYKVTVCKCIPKQKVETYTCCEERKIPYEACRIVCKCVPVQEQVTCCRMVKKCVEKQVPVCEESCNPCGGKKWSLKKSCCK